MLPIMTVATFLTPGRLLNSHFAHRIKTGSQQLECVWLPRTDYPQTIRGLHPAVQQTCRHLETHRHRRQREQVGSRNWRRPHHKRP